MRVLFTTTPGRGHFYPMVPLAKACAEKGHDVAWAAGEGVRPLLESEGFEVKPSGFAHQDDFFAEFQNRFPEARDLPPPERPPFMFPRVFGAVCAPRMLDDLLPIARDWRPSLLVCDQAELAGPVAAAALGVPNATHSFGSRIPAQRVQDAGEQVAHLWEANGLEPRPFAGTYDHLFLYIYPPSLQEPEAEHVPEVHPLRPVTFAAANGGGGGVPDWLDAESDEPLIYVTFGTLFNDHALIATVVDAIRGLPVRVVVTLGPGAAANALGEQPANVYVADYIPQTEVLPHCAAVISHAGSGTFLAGLARGLPQLLLPQAADQFLNAEAGARSGAAISIPPAEFSPEKVREATRRLLADPSFRSAAELLAAEIEAMPGPGDAVAELERRFATG